MKIIRLTNQYIKQVPWRGIDDSVVDKSNTVTNNICIPKYNMLLNHYSR